jgi:hypothetical protein
MIKQRISKKFEIYCKENKTRQAKFILKYLRRFISPYAMGMGIFYVVNNNNVKFAKYLFNHKYHFLTDYPNNTSSYYMYVAATSGKVGMLKLILDELNITNIKYIIETFTHTCSHEHDSMIYYILYNNSNNVEVFTKSLSLLLNNNNILSILLNNIDINDLSIHAQKKLMKHLNIKMFSEFEKFLKII